MPTPVTIACVVHEGQPATATRQFMPPEPYEQERPLFVCQDHATEAVYLDWVEWLKAHAIPVVEA
jgi:hypothetical protein